MIHCQLPLDEYFLIGIAIYVLVCARGFLSLKHLEIAFGEAAFGILATVAVTHFFFALLVSSVLFIVSLFHYSPKDD